MNEKEWICNAAKDLHQDQYLELLKIVTFTNTKYTENNNGIFIDLDQIDDVCIKKMISYLKYSQENTVCTNVNNGPIYNNTETTQKIQHSKNKKILTAGMSPDEMDYQETETDIDNLSLPSCIITQTDPISNSNQDEQVDDQNEDTNDDRDDFELNELSDDDV